MGRAWWVEVVGRGCESWVWVWVNVVGKKSIEKNDKKIIIIIKRKKLWNIYERKISNSLISLFVTASSSSSSRYFLSHLGLRSPFTPSLYKRHYMLPMKIYKRNRRKSYVQFAESMGLTALTINLYSIYNSNDQRRFLNTMECDHRGKGQGNFTVFHIFA